MTIIWSIAIIALWLLSGISVWVLMVRDGREITIGDLVILPVYAVWGCVTVIVWAISQPKIMNKALWRW